MAAQYPLTTRADARLNRERILSVAYKAFAHDPDVSLNRIGKLAGVGAGTLYRHFPTREDLILAVYRQELQSMVDSVHACGSCDWPTSRGSSTVLERRCRRPRGRTSPTKPLRRSPKP